MFFNTIEEDQLTERELTERDLLQSALEQFNKINADIESDCINRMIGYHFGVTGAFGYRFFKNGERICSVTSDVVPSPPVLIYGGGIALRSDFDNDSTIIPGLARKINNEMTGKQLFRIVYKDEGVFEINESVEVYCDKENYVFYVDDTAIAKITRWYDKPDLLEELTDTDYEYEPYFEVAADKGIETSLLMVILAFPMLRFAW